MITGLSGLTSGVASQYVNFEATTIPTTAPQQIEPVSMEENATQLQTDVSALARELSYTSMPRDMMYSAQRQKIKATDRDEIYLNRQEIYEDAFVVKMLDVMIIRAIGSTLNDVQPFKYTINQSLADKLGIHENILEQIKERFETVEILADEDLLEVIRESLFMSDGYSYLDGEDGVGLKNVIHNFSTKAFNVTPFVSNKGREVLYEVSGRNSTYEKRATFSSRSYIEPHKVARLNAKSNGVRQITSSSLIGIDNMNVFSDKEYIYEDLVYGGVVEGCLESYKMYKRAIRSLVNARITSGQIERFIIHNLQDTSEEERKILKEALLRNLAKVKESVNKKIKDDVTEPEVVNHHLPTTGDGTNGIEIQESTPNFAGFQSIEDIMIHIKKFIGDIGFSLDLTAFSTQQIGGNNEGEFPRTSLQMEAQAELVRKSTRKYLLKIIETDLAYLGMKLPKNLIKVEFTSVVNMTQATDENNRMQSLQNSSQFWAFIEQLKGLELEDNELNRVMLADQIEQKMEQSTKNKEESLKAIIKIVIKKAEVQNEE